DANELSTWSAREGAFFGNLFDGTGVFACSERTLNAQESTVRACALSAQSSGTSSECAPIVIVGNCNSACIKSDFPYWSSCSHGGVTYLPLTTRLQPTDIYQCGDGVCQSTESCGNSNRYNSCQADCGSC
ncbi:MAG TPA: hypothetical protein VK447_11250, partial [Myxococcaceae bacterium]|nr:hypothetical protein [Myxococcaceae bacterium]